MSDSKVDFLGIPLARFHYYELLQWIVQAAGSGEPHTSYAINAHSVNMAFKHPAYMQALKDCDLVYCDGISVLWGSRLLGDPIPERLATSDLFDDICRNCIERGFKVYFLGNEPWVIEKGVAKIREMYPDMQIVGHHSGFFLPGEEEKVVQEIKSLQPHLLWVGMGNPVQELWVEKHKKALQIPLIMTCGAMMEFFAGKIVRAPRWMHRNGLEWLYRLVDHPTRVWRRYLLGNPIFIARLLYFVWKRK